MKYEECCERCGDQSWGGPRCAGGCGDCCCGDVGCGKCVDDCCGGCDGGCSSKCRWPRLAKMWRRCTGCYGCGELYWSEWFNDPPSCCEPCNCRGQYVGRGATAPGVLPYRSDMIARSNQANPVEPLQVAAAVDRGRTPEPGEFAEEDEAVDSIDAIDAEAESSQLQQNRNVID
jgi:hypothetical protein